MLVPTQTYGFTSEMCRLNPPPDIWCAIQICGSGLDLPNEKEITFLHITLPWLSSAVVQGEVGGVPGNGADGTKGDLIVWGSNHEVQRASWSDGCRGGWWHVLEKTFSILYSCHHLPLRPRYKDVRGQASQVISSLCTNPALWHCLHLTLIPHQSEAKTCLAFDSKPLKLFGQPLT